MTPPKTVTKNPVDATGLIWRSTRRAASLSKALRVKSGPSNSFELLTLSALNDPQSHLGF
jgi:hypothetical protein